MDFSAGDASAPLVWLHTLEVIEGGIAVPVPANGLKMHSASAHVMQAVDKLEAMSDEEMLADVLASLKKVGIYCKARTVSAWLVAGATRYSASGYKLSGSRC